MPRTLEFDPEVALDSAMNIFWQKGYEATSLRDLVEGMQINKFSIYNTFGNKHKLFLDALAWYLDLVGTISMGIILREGGGISAIEEYFFAIIDRGLGPNGWRGCFVLNSLVELGTSDEEVFALLNPSLDKIRSAFAIQLTYAVSDTAQPATDTYDWVDREASQLVRDLLAITILGRIYPDRVRLRSEVAEVLERVRKGALRAMGA